MTREVPNSLTVAINAQIAVDFPGGTESNLLSLIEALGNIDAEERFLLIGHRKRSTDLIPFMGPNQTLLDWPFHQVWYTPLFTFRVPLGVRSRRLQKALGVLGPAVVPAGYLAYRVGRHLYRLQRYGRRRNPTASEADSVLRARGVSVVHFPYALPFETELPFIYEPFDLQHRHHPEFFSRRERWWRDRVYGAACRRAALIVTATRWTKQDIIKEYAIAPTKIAVIPRGPMLRGKPLSPVEKARVWRDRGIPEEFAFYPAMTFPHKNHIRLLRALARLRDERGIQLPLVCCGRFYMPHWPKIEAEIHRLRLQDQVLFLGPVSDEMLTSLFESARFMIFPSLFEGLALPVLEAMSHGLPALASDAACIPEIAADGAILFDAESVEAMVDMMTEAVKNPAMLEQVRSRGPGVVSRLSWEKAARMFIACYRWVSGQPLSEEQKHLFTEAIEG